MPLAENIKGIQVRGQLEQLETVSHVSVKRVHRPVGLGWERVADAEAGCG